MPRKGTHTPLDPQGDPNDPHGWHALTEAFLEWMGVRSQHARLVPVRAFFKWAARHNHILYNPASEIDLPRLDHRLPKHVLNPGEVEKILQLCNTNLTTDPTGLGLRDRAILETFYSTGMRRSELMNLKLYDIDPERGTLFIRQGKGRKDRMVPVGDRALAWIIRYRDEIRPMHVREPDDGTLFLTNLFEAFTPNRLTQLVRDYINAAELGKTGSCHLLRHTCATIMLENGADIRFIQQLLGHAELTTTQIYTQVSIQKLKQVHQACHPSSSLEKPGDRKAPKPPKPEPPPP